MSSDRLLGEIYADILRDSDVDFKDGKFVRVSRMTNQMGSVEDVPYRRSYDVASSIFSKAARNSGVVSWARNLESKHGHNIGDSRQASFSLFAPLVDPGYNLEGKSPRDLLREGKTSVNLYLGLPDKVRKDIFDLESFPGRNYLSSLLMNFDPSEHSNLASALEVDPRIVDLFEKAKSGVRRIVDRRYDDKMIGYTNLGDFIYSVLDLSFEDVEEAAQMASQTRLKDVSDGWHEVEVDEYVIGDYSHELGLRN